MLQDDTFDYVQIQKFYDIHKYCPLEPSPFVQKYGEVIFTFFQKSFSILANKQVAVLLGYYSSHTYMEIMEVRSFFKDRQHAIDVISGNILLFELTHDLLLFDKYRDTDHFLSIFGKYLCRLVGNPSQEFSDYIQELIHKYSNPNSDEEIEIMQKTIAAVSFEMFHEFGHMRRNIIESTISMFTETAGFLNSVEKLSAQQMEEAACDFCALYVMTNRDLLKETLESSIKCSTTDVLAYGIIMQHADSLLQLLKFCFRIGSRIDSLTVNEIFSDVMYQLQTRCKTLLVATKLSENTEGFSLGELDVNIAFNHATDLMRKFFSCASDAMRQMADKIDEINSTNSSGVTLTLNKPIDREKIWFLIK